MRRGAIEFEKIAMWALGVILALVLIGFIIAQLNPGSEGGLMAQALERINATRG